MLPIILIYQDIKDIDKYLNDLINKNKYISYNIFRISPTKKELSIAEIRDLNRILVIKYFENRLYILYDFHTATTEAQNALLKSLEEKNSKNQFVLISENEYAILPTIRSRSKIVYLENLGESKEKASSLDLLKKVNKSANYNFLSDKNVVNITREEADQLIDDIISYYRKNLLLFSDISPIVIKKALRMKALIKNNYLNTQLAIDNLLISIKKLYKMREKA